MSCEPTNRQPTVQTAPAAIDDTLTAVEAMRQACAEAVVANQGCIAVLAAITRIDAGQIIAAARSTNDDAAQLRAMAQLQIALNRRSSMPLTRPGQNNEQQLTTENT